MREAAAGDGADAAGVGEPDAAPLSAEVFSLAATPCAGGTGGAVPWDADGAPGRFSSPTIASAGPTAEAGSVSGALGDAAALAALAAKEEEAGAGDATGDGDTGGNAAASVDTSDFCAAKPGTARPLPSHAAAFKRTPRAFPAGWVFLA